jgi:hypothetical protein
MVMILHHLKLTQETRVANRVQTKKRAVVVAGIQEAVDSAGVASEMARQKAYQRY